ncbi:MAG: AI-2E family transporter [Leptodesmis sp.]|uniref:AI-2E family transporter n=1 Tax=Leptodesmis sp. TaxID=3100501 RepID=UPI003D0F594B
MNNSTLLRFILLFICGWFTFLFIIATLQNGLTSGLGLVKGAFSSLFVTLFGVVICLYMVIDGEKLWNMALKVIPVASRDRFARTFQLSFQGFIWGTIVLMLYYATSSLILFSLVGIQNALILAVILGSVPVYWSAGGWIVGNLSGGSYYGHDCGLDAIAGRGEHTCSGSKL